MPNSNNLWVLSRHYIEMFDGEVWYDIVMPFCGRFMPFQYVLPISEYEILIFGGLRGHEKSQEVRVYNVRANNVNYYGRMMPQGICV